MTAIKPTPYAELLQERPPLLVASGFACEGWPVTVKHQTKVGLKVFKTAKAPSELTARGYNRKKGLGLLPLDGVLHQFHGVFQIELFLDVRTVRFNGFDAEMKFFGNLTGAIPLAD